VSVEQVRADAYAASVRFFRLQRPVGAAAGR
jgi:hypothetical protein